MREVAPLGGGQTTSVAEGVRKFWRYLSAAPGRLATSPSAVRLGDTPLLSNSKMTAVSSLPIVMVGWQCNEGRAGRCSQLALRVLQAKLYLASPGPLPLAQPIVVHTHGGLTSGGDAQEQSIKTVS